MKTRIFTIIFVLIIGLHTIPSKAQSAQTLTLKMCREMALQNNYTLKNGMQNIALAENMLASYKANNYPKLSFTSSYIYSTMRAEAVIEGGYLPTYSPDATTGELIPNIAGVDGDGNPIFSQYAYMPDQDFLLEVGSFFTANLQLVQPIYMGGKISNATKLAAVGVRVAELDKQKNESEIILEVDKAYYTYMNVKEQLAAAQKYYKAVDEFFTQVSNALKNGMATNNDLLKVQIKVNEAELLVRKAENGLRLARTNLCYTIGIDMTTQNIEIEDIAEKSLIINDKSLDITSRPEYAMLQHQIEAKELQVKLTKSDYLPSISALASYGYSYGLQLNGETLINGDNIGSFTGGVMVTIPILNWGEGSRKVKAGQNEVEIARNQLSDLSQKMTLELMQAINAFDEACIEVALLETSLNQAEENMRQSCNNYTQGMETIANYLESQAMWQNAMSELTQAKSALRIAYVYYQKTAGKSLQEISANY